jgi:hypothetical protein
MHQLQFIEGCQLLGIFEDALPMYWQAAGFDEIEFASTRVI